MIGARNSHFSVTFLQVSGHGRRQVQGPEELEEDPHRAHRAEDPVAQACGGRQAREQGTLPSGPPTQGVSSYSHVDSVASLSSCVLVALHPIHACEASRAPAHALYPPRTRDKIARDPQSAGGLFGFGGGGAVLLDIREEEKFEFEHAKGAVNVPLYVIMARLSALLAQRACAARP